ncbi:MAG: SUMF1/EgtB/PvdO family nonheme iron enzyme [Lentisphaerae bacterium]|jgi:formylglycine-generating enzyme required for sulfatase activity|nr:SUMF1/EgtB/PvdO family nonheme iron enzyme [Lentisphaerota bacterium]MBT5611212.1 SUMF1/EgtB/PvdO family nonheme iron enzyme [Lentisphaerota bacterium]MBT7059155.1 SUMF1/EgtB/PvdO family nonheme iron enzyme [Lentisphaerota bacterium]MBT7842919.1 SUMF1/EgtB/PvdO family nonheme iron enzyme [Lentisphaerota bacterium]
MKSSRRQTQRRSVARALLTSQMGRISRIGLIGLIVCSAFCPPSRAEPRVSGAIAPGPASDGTVLIPGGTFQMGDHHDLGGREHRNDEVPIHEVTLEPYHVGIHETTNAEYCRFLNAASARGLITVLGGNVFKNGTETLYCETRPAVAYSHLVWDGRRFNVETGKDRHPVVCIRWEGAVAYCNWLSAEKELMPCYDLNTWACDYTRNGYRLPTEAEWEFAGRGGLHAPYRVYPWGDDADSTRANWPNSRDPYEAGPYPWTTPVGFYNGELRKRSELNWPGQQSTYRTGDGVNGYGLHDMAGNVWEWCNDWYTNTYYAAGPSVNPEGPLRGRPMPDGKPYRVLRSGNWYNGAQGHSRVSNRDPAHFRGPQDPNHPYYHVGFRIVRDAPGDGPRSESGQAKTIGAVSRSGGPDRDDFRRTRRRAASPPDSRDGKRWGPWRPRPR